MDGFYTLVGAVIDLINLSPLVLIILLVVYSKKKNKRAVRVCTILLISVVVLETLARIVTVIG